MTDLARGAGALPPVQAPTPALGLAVASARRSFGIVRPSMPRPPTFSMWRREKRAEVWKLSQAEVRRFMASIPARRSLPLGVFAARPHESLFQSALGAPLGGTAEVVATVGAS